MIDRRQFMSLGLGATTLGTVGVGGPLLANAVKSGGSSRSRRKRNLLAIVADDLGTWGVKCYGNDDAETPHLDDLAHSGAQFTNAFAVSGVCTPNRVAYLTGLYPIEVGLLDVPYRSDPFKGLPENVPSWPRVLKASGYKTGLIGKWHLGRHVHPSQFGMDYFFGFLGGAADGTNPELTREMGNTRQYEGELADLLTADAVKFIEESRDEPFALLVHYREPHAPHFPVDPIDVLPFVHRDVAVPLVDRENAVLDDDQDPPDKLSKAVYEHVMQERIKTYYAQVHLLDRSVGRLLDALGDTGEEHETIVMFQSDHGYMYGHRGLKGKGAAQTVPFHLQAQNNFYINMYDLSIRIPLLIKWPGVVEPGVVQDELVGNIDTFRSVLGMLDIPEPADCPKSGHDFSALLRTDRSAQHWRNVLFGEYTSEDVGNIEFVRMARTNDWKLVRAYLNVGGNQLFDLHNDPAEMNNLYYAGTPRLSGYIGAWNNSGSRIRKNPYQAKLDKLQEALTAWQRQIGDPALELERIFEQHKQKVTTKWNQ